MFALFNFTIRQVFCQKKIWFTLLLLILPIGLTLLIDKASPPKDAHELWKRYHMHVNSFIFMMILPLMCMVHGIALIGAEAENGTLAYLLTRKLRRTTVLVVRFAAMVLVLTVLSYATLILQYLAALGGVDVQALGSPHDQVWHPFSELLSYLYVTPFAVAAYLSMFVLISLVMARPLTASIMYAVIVEMFLANLPLGVRVYSVAYQIRSALFRRIHHLNILFEDITEMIDESFLANHAGIATLTGIVLAALALGCLFMSSRELIPAKVGSD